MNANDIKLMNGLIPKIREPTLGNRVLFLVNYMQIAKTNLILLKALLEELNRRGIFISIDRPHRYMGHLLRIHRINYTNLLFIDTITTFSSDKFDDDIEQSSVKVIESPFQIHLLPELLSMDSQYYGNMGYNIDLAGVDFILIDNIASMLNYNDHVMVEGFLESYLNKLTENKNIFTPILLDRNTHSALYESVKRLCDGEIDVDEIENVTCLKDDGADERLPYNIKKKLFQNKLDVNSYSGGH
jgi:hypothetical protein